MSPLSEAHPSASIGRHSRAGFRKDGCVPAGDVGVGSQLGAAAGRYAFAGRLDLGLEQTVFASAWMQSVGRSPGFLGPWWPWSEEQEDLTEHGGDAC